MRTHLLVSSNRARFITAVAAITFVAWMMAGPPAAGATAVRPGSVLAQGTGTHGTPSIRVRALQRALVQRGYHLGVSGIDGVFGRRTARAVRRLQAAQGLPADGIVGPRTRRVLRSPVRPGAGEARPVTQRTVAETMPAAPASSRLGPAPASAGAPLRAQRSSASATVITALLAIVMAAGCALAYARRRRRDEARIARYRLRWAEPAGAARPAVGAGGAEPVEIAPARTTPRRRGARWGVLAGTAVIGYIQDPGDRDAADVRGLEEVIERACDRAAWHLVDVVRDQSTGPLLERPGLARALERIADGEARGLVVTETRTLSQSTGFGELVAWFRDGEAALITLDLGIDTSTPEGNRVASALITLNGWAASAAATQAGRLVMVRQVQGRAAAPNGPNGES